MQPAAGLCEHLRPVTEDTENTQMTALAEPDTTAAVETDNGRSTGSSMIVMESVSKVYETNHVTALDNVSYVIDKGEFVFVVGASGSRTR